MHLNFKIFLCTLFCIQLGWSQEKTKDTTVTKKEFSELFFEIAYAQPLFYGDNFISEGYDVSGTVDFGVTTTFFYNTSLHFDVNIASGDVVRPDLIGNIRSSVFTRVSAGIGYPLDIIDKLSFLPSLHLGYLKIGSTIEDEKFRDDAIFVAAEAALYYAVFDWMDISLGAKNYFDFTRIEAPSQQQSFFDNAQSVYPFLGLRFTVGK